MKLDPVQSKVVTSLRKDKAALIPPTMGTGKTLVACAAALDRNPDTVLVICPLGTRVGWERHFRALGYTGEIVRLESGKKTLKEDFQRLLKGDPAVYLIGWEYMIRQKHVMWAKVHPDVVIADEVHRAQNRKSVTFTELKRIKTKAGGLKMGLSGTWFGERIEGAWAVLRALWPELIDTSYWRWVDQWCLTVSECTTCFEAVPDDWDEHHCPTCYNDRDTRKRVVGEKNPGALVKSLPAYYMWTAPDSGDDKWKEEPLQHGLYAELSRKHRKVYTQMEDDLLSWVDDQPIVAEIPATKSIRLRQMTLGVPTIDAESDTVSFDKDCESPKIEVLKEFMADHPDKNLLVLTDSKKFADILPHRLATKGTEVHLWTGDTKQATREAILVDWATDTGNRKVLVAVIAAIAEGVDGLQHNCHTAVWMNKSRYGVHNEQVLGRLARRGQKERVVEVTITATDTVDDPDYKRLDDALQARGASLGLANV